MFSPMVGWCLHARRFAAYITSQVYPRDMPVISTYISTISHVIYLQHFTIYIHIYIQLTKWFYDQLCSPAGDCWCHWGNWPTNCKSNERCCWPTPALPRWSGCSKAFQDDWDHYQLNMLEPLMINGCIHHHWFKTQLAIINCPIKLNYIDYISYAVVCCIIGFCYSLVGDGWLIGEEMSKSVGLEDHTPHLLNETWPKTEWPILYYLYLFGQVFVIPSFP